MIDPGGFMVKVYHTFVDGSFMWNGAMLNMCNIARDDKAYKSRLEKIKLFQK